MQACEGDDGPREPTERSSSSGAVWAPAGLGLRVSPASHTRQPRPPGQRPTWPQVFCVLRESSALSEECGHRGALEPRAELRGPGAEENVL